MDNLGFEPIKFDEVGKATLYRWNLDAYKSTLSPAKQRNWTRRHKVNSIVFSLYRHIPWMNWPILKVVYTFWHGIFEEGIKYTCKPRWGILTFAYLNDGNKPTLWHTWRQITHDHNDKYTGLYVGFKDRRGAPKSLAQAKQWEAEMEAERRKNPYYNYTRDDIEAMVSDKELMRDEFHWR